MTTKPNYARIAELERELFGEPLSAPATPWRDVPEPLAHPAGRHHDVHELDASVRDAARLLLSWGPVPPELAGSWVVTASRVAVQALLATALILTCLALAGVVPWSG